MKTGQELTFMIYPQTSLSPTFCPKISEKELPLELLRLPNNGGAANQVGGEEISGSERFLDNKNAVNVCRKIVIVHFEMTHGPHFPK